MRCFIILTDTVKTSHGALVWGANNLEVGGGDCCLMLLHFSDPIEYIYVTYRLEVSDRKIFCRGLKNAYSYSSVNINFTPRFVFKKYHIWTSRSGSQNSARCCGHQIGYIKLQKRLGFRPLTIEKKKKILYFTFLVLVMLVGLLFMEFEWCFAGC